jgi:hypothetical protein
MSIERYTAFRLLLPNGVLFYPSEAPILTAKEFDAIIKALDAGEGSE